MSIKSIEINTEDWDQYSMWQHKTFCRVEVQLKLPQVSQALVVTIDRIEIKCFRQKKRTKASYKFCFILPNQMKIISFFPSDLFFGVLA